MAGALRERRRAQIWMTLPLYTIGLCQKSPHRVSIECMFVQICAGNNRRHDQHAAMCCFAADE
jgi:hypothetical protein